MMNADLIFFYTGKAFWIAFAAAVLVGCIAAFFGAVFWAAQKTFNGAASWLGARYVLDPKNKSEIRDNMMCLHDRHGLDAKALEGWLEDVWKRAGNK